MEKTTPSQIISLPPEQAVAMLQEQVRELEVELSRSRKMLFAAVVGAFGVVLLSRPERNKHAMK